MWQVEFILDFNWSVSAFFIKCKKYLYEFLEITVRVPRGQVNPVRERDICIT